MKSYPRRKGELVQSAGSEGWTVYEPESDSLHALNDTARALWELCDGSTSPSEMATAITELTGMSASEAAADVSSALERLKQLGLVDYETAG